VSTMELLLTVCRKRRTQNTKCCKLTCTYLINIIEIDKSTLV
jgi:hypothetical protein